MEPRRRRQFSPAEKREAVQLHRASGLSVRSFCEREGLSATCFYRWRAEFSEATAAGSLAAAPAPAAFVDLGPLRPSRGRLALRLELGEGVVLEITRG
jgi:transposase-like protein